MSYKHTNNKSVRSQDSEVAKNNNEIDPLGSIQATEASLEGESAKKEETIPKSIRLSQLAFDALRVLEGKYGQTRSDIVSAAIIAHAKSAAAVPILRYSMMGDKSLFALQAAATDIKTGLSNLRHDLFKARKSGRDPKELKALYIMLSKKYQKVLIHAEKTLTLMDKECLLHDLLQPSDYTLLIQALEKLKRTKAKNRTERQLMELHIKIYEILIN